MTQSRKSKRYDDAVQILKIYNQRSISVILNIVPMEGVYVHMILSEQC